MCEAQIASLRSRLERRVNRIPSSKRNMKLVDLLDAATTTKAAPAKKEVALAQPPVRTVVPAPAPAARKTRTAPAARKDAPKPIPAKETRKPTQPALQPALKPAAKTAPKTTRGTKRSSDEMGDNKENANELAVPKKRTKTAAALAHAPKPGASTRTTRAASRKVVPQAPQVLSPKPNNSRPAPRARRQR